jgi:hypothetical protein
MSKQYETPDIIGAKALDNYLIYLIYETKEEKIYDMKELIKNNKFYNRLLEKKYFKELTIRGDSIEWKCGEDVAPENLYYKSVNKKDFKEKLKELD